jgi:hypothetical protein
MTRSTSSTTHPVAAPCLEREALEEANAEAASLRRSHRLQQEFLSRLNHELRTPLTAIQGCVPTLRQTDVQWDVGSQQRFLDSIAPESARMGGSSATCSTSGPSTPVLRLARTGATWSWCSRPRRCVPVATRTRFDMGDARSSRRSGVTMTGSSRSS